MRLYQQLRRRRVFRVAIAYVVGGWALVEAGSVLFPMFAAPDWAPRVLTIAVALGFPIAIVLTWLIQWTPAGLVVDHPVESRLRPPDSGKIRFVIVPDGTRLAYSSIGSGPMLVKTAHWLTHLEKDLASPLWRHWLAALTESRCLLRYDERGCGLSDREVANLNLDAFVMDLEAVVDATGVDRFALFGASQGGPASVAYAVRHPERVSALILFGSYARGWRRRDDPEAVRQEEAMVDLIRTGWGQDNPAFRQLYASLFVPDASPEQVGSFVDMARESTTPEMAARLMTAFAEIDVRDLLPRVRVPTLVAHVRNDARIPIENGRELAAGIPGAEFVSLEGHNHIILEHEPAFGELRAVLSEFLGRHAA